MEWDALWNEMKRQWMARKMTWTETTEAMYYDQLCCLPPERQSGCGFLVGEAAFSNANGKPVYSCFIQKDGKFFARYMTTETFEVDPDFLLFDLFGIEGEAA